MIELLAITDDAAPTEPPLRIVRAGGLAVVIAPASEGEVDADALWRREALLEELMQQRALLPVRYGTLVEDEAAAAAAVAGRGEALAGALRGVRGAVELSVRAVAPDSRTREPGEHLQARAAHERTAAALHERLAAAARGRCATTAASCCGRRHLVDRAEVDRFVSLVRGLQAEHAELSILCAAVAALFLRRAGGRMRDKVLAGPLDGDLDPFARPSRGLSNSLSRRIDADPESVEQGLAQLVLTIVELLRQLMERQALRRIDGGGLTEEQIERLGTTFMELDRRMEELRDHFGLAADDLNLDLGPLGRLL